MSIDKENRQKDQQEAAEKAKYIWADEVAELANRLIQDHHGHLVEAKIAYIFRTDEWKKKGRLVGGSAKTVNSENKFLNSYDFIITINMDVWNKADIKQRAALVDHELTHCSYTEDQQGKKRWCIEDHDVQEFNTIVRRYGLWEDNLKRFDNARQQHGQLTLAFDASAAAKTGTEG